MNLAKIKRQWLAAMLRHNYRGVKRFNTSEMPEYYAWKNMIRRCYVPHCPGYSNWGGRGIRVCDAWRSQPDGFWQFLADVGLRPTPGHSLNRINNDGNYEPDNVNWATAAEQNANKREVSNASLRRYWQRRTGVIVHLEPPTIGGEWPCQ